MLLRKLSDCFPSPFRPQHQRAVILSAGRSLRDRPKSKDLRLLFAMRAGWVSFEIVLILLSFCLSCRATFAQQEQRWVILPQSEGKFLIGIRPLGLSNKVTGTWQPAQADVDAAEANLKQISVFPKSNYAWLPIEHPERYFRQYLGLLQGARKLIYLSAYCGEDDYKRAPYYWRDRLFMIADGGDCVWKALYDVAAKKFVSLSINGLA